MSHLWENLRAHYRPLLLYLFMEVLGKATRLIMTSYGFKIKRFGWVTVTTYWNTLAVMDCSSVLQ